MKFFALLLVFSLVFQSVFVSPVRVWSVSDQETVSQEPAAENRGGSALAAESTEKTEKTDSEETKNKSADPEPVKEKKQDASENASSDKEKKEAGSEQGTAVKTVITEKKEGSEKNGSDISVPEKVSEGKADKEDEAKPEAEGTKKEEKGTKKEENGNTSSEPKIAASENKDDAPQEKAEEPSSEKKEASEKKENNAGADLDLMIGAVLAESVPEAKEREEQTEGAEAENQDLKEVPAAETSAAADETTASGEESEAETTAAEETEESEAETETEAEGVPLNESSVTFRGSANSVNVTVKAAPGTFPEGTTMSVTGVSASSIMNKVEQTVDGEVEKIKAVDITFHDRDGKKIQPLKAVNVKLSTKAFDEDAEQLEVIHISGGKADVVSDVNAGGSTATASFSANSFSIYAVVETGTEDANARLIYRFYHGSEQFGEDQLVKTTDTLYDPGVPELGEDQLFKGWCLDAELAGESMTIQDLNDDLASRTNVKEGDVVAVYAKIFDAYFVEYRYKGGSADIVLKTDAVTVKEGEEASAEINMAYTPASDEQHFAGWSENPEDAEAAVYANNTTISLTKRTTVLYPVLQEGHWLSFEENDGGPGTGRATYIPPVFIPAGETVESAKPEDPTRPGYTFSGWFADPDCTEEFVWTETLARDTTAYAKWTAAEKTKYTVSVWIQNANNSASYDYVSSNTVENVVPDTMITEEMITAGLPEGYVLGKLWSGKDPTYKFKEYKIRNGSGTEGTGVHAYGDTVVNVYYDRELLTINFYDSYTETTSPQGTETQYGIANGKPVELEYKGKKWKIRSTGKNYNGKRYLFTQSVNPQKISGLYGSKISDWPSDNGWAYDRFEEVSVAFMNVLAFAGHEDAVSADGLVMNLYACPVSGDDDNSYKKIEYYLQNLDGEYEDKDPDYTDYTLENSVPIVNDKFGSGFSPAEYRLNPGQGQGGWWESIGDLNELDNIKKTTKIRYSRNSFRIEYWKVTPDGTFKIGESDPILYEASIAGIKLPTVDVDAHSYFDGWYEDESVTTPLNLTGKIMPANNLSVYASVQPVEYHVVVESDGGTLLNNQSTSFWVDYGEALDGANFLGATKENCSLVGWYMDEACTKPWNFSTRITGGSTISITYSGPDDPARAYYEDEDYPSTLGVLTLYAKWRDNSTAEEGGLTVQYVDEDGETLIYTDPLKYADQAEVPAAKTPGAEYIPEGMEFAGWVLNEKSYMPGETFVADKQDAENLVITLTASYKKKGAAPVTTLTYDPNGGTGSAKTYEVKVNETQTARNNTDSDLNYTREEYMFLGWNTDKDAETALFAAGDQIAADKLKEDTDNILYGIWEALFDVSYSYTGDVPEGAAAVPEEQKDQRRGTEITVAEEPADIADYVFTGWITADAEVTAGSFTMPAGDVAFTGEWKEDKNNNDFPDEDEDRFSVTYNDGADGSVFATEVYENILSGLATPAFTGSTDREGFTFTGWTPAVADTVTENAVYTAVWSEVKNEEAEPPAQETDPENPDPVQPPVNDDEEAEEPADNDNPEEPADDDDPEEPADNDNPEAPADDEEQEVSDTDDDDNTPAQDRTDAADNNTNADDDTPEPVPAAESIAAPPEPETTAADRTEETVPETAEAAEPEEIDEPDTPLAAPAKELPEGSWALLNLIMAAVTAILSAGMLITIGGKRRKKNRTAKLCSLIPAAGAIIAFVLTENMGLKMQMTDKWTLLMAGILAVQVILAVISVQSEKKEEHTA